MPLPRTGVRHPQARENQTPTFPTQRQRQQNTLTLPALHNCHSAAKRRNLHLPVLICICLCFSAFACASLHLPVLLFLSFPKGICFSPSVVIPAGNLLLALGCHSRRESAFALGCHSRRESAFALDCHSRRESASRLWLSFPKGICVCLGCHSRRESAFALGCHSRRESAFALGCHSRRESAFARLPSQVRLSRRYARPTCLFESQPIRRIYNQDTDT